MLTQHQKQKDDETEPCVGRLDSGMPMTGQRTDGDNLALLGITAVF